MPQSPKYVRLTPVNSVRMIQVIEVVSLIGKGITGNPIREVTEYYSLDGDRLARTDGDTDLDNGVWNDEQ